VNSSCLFLLDSNNTVSCEWESGVAEVSGVSEVSGSVSVSESWGAESVSLSWESESGWGGSSDGWGSLDNSWGSLDKSWGVCDSGVMSDTGVGVSAGLEQGLLISGVSGDWSDDGLLSEQLLLLEDGLGNVLGGDNSGGLDSLDGCWSVDVSGLSNWDGPGGQLWGDLGVSVSLSGGVGEVTAQPVALDGGRVVSWGTDQSGSGHHWGWDGWDDSAGSGSQGRGKDSDEGLHFR